MTEYSIEVALLLPGADGRFVFHSRGPATAGGASDGDAAAEIALSPDNRFVYAGIRGSNRIAVLAVEGSGTRLRPVADVPSGGDWPRHHLVRDGWLHVAHERSNQVTSFALDPVTGIPGEVFDQLSTGSPTALVPAP